MRGTLHFSTVVKVGGSQLQRDEQLAQLSAYVRRLQELGESTVVVHGGGPEIGELHRSLDLPFRKHRGLRVTADESMPLVTMVLCGLINKRVVARLSGDGLAAIGLSGVDGAVLRSAFLNREMLGRVGGPPQVDAEALVALLRLGWIVVLAPVCLGPDAQPINVNADTVAHAVAARLGATRLEFVSDVPGVKLPRDGVAERLSAVEVRRLLGGAAITGGMIPKLQAALAAVDAGVGRVRVGDLPAMLDDTATEITS